MTHLVLKALGIACLAFSCVGFIEIAAGFAKNGTYVLLRAIVYSILLGIGLSLIF